MSFPPYAEYKDSGVAWLGAVPGHWEVTRLKLACEVFPSNVDKKSVEGEAAVRLCNYTNVYYHERITDDFPFMEATATDDQIARFTLKAGDTIITKDSETPDDIARSAYVPETLEGVICGYHLSMVRPREVACGAFIKRYFDTPSARAYFHVSANGLTRVGLGQYALDNAPIALPPLAEQEAIAGFLDREVGKIDGLVAEQERLIALLKEKRQTVISHAVTKGLNASAPLKDSGIEWLGQIPEHWEVKPLKYGISFIESGVSVNAIDVPASDDEIGVLKTSAVYTGQFRPEENKAVIAEERDRASCPVKAGCLIVSRMNTPDLVGATGLVIEDAPNLFLPDRLWQVHFSELEPAFTHLWTQSPFYRSQVQVACAGTSSSMQNLSLDEFKSFLCPFPPTDEQAQIAVRVVEVMSGYEKLMTEAQSAITLLQERRAALISAAVTGKIDVRAAALDSTAELETA
ncbi:restriction endonuclease subunit S [Novosphingobium sp. FSY-8]|uniref:Restriction endonuclease subunit S n=1 Tax=Novosphingobium ovatum TaxID=1908523 RepID=A0ABW9XCJ6_9SPHN|nr:restriction endonuclease subunit S [Novosphingobium ovatum]NBC36253.1 restriction endonuclease subunit S [Novosphingobium ovatum]